MNRTVNFRCPADVFITPVATAHGAGHKKLRFRRESGMDGILGVELRPLTPLNHAVLIPGENGLAYLFCGALNVECNAGRPFREPAYF